MFGKVTGKDPSCFIYSNLLESQLELKGSEFIPSVIEGWLRNPYLPSRLLTRLTL
jgi:hypothetical protein